MKVYNKYGNRYDLEPSPISSGGEGEIYLVQKAPTTSPVGSLCAKVYYRDKRTNELAHKLEYMIHNPVASPYDDTMMICWPIELIYDSDSSFLGFVMRRAFTGSEQLVNITTPTLNPHLPDSWRNKYTGANAFTSRLKLINNIALIIWRIHETGKYLLGDFKPENVLVMSDGRVALVDLDSIQIMNGNYVLYSGSAATPNYMPPDFYVVGEKASHELSWDNFSIAVVFYQVLFGIHPYTVIPKNGYESIPHNIKNQLFAHGEKRSFIETIPPPHKAFQSVPVELQKLFLRAFGNVPSDRPNMDEWGKTIMSILYPKVNVTHNQGTTVNQLNRDDIECQNDLLKNKNRKLNTEINQLKNDKKTLEERINILITEKDSIQQKNSTLSKDYSNLKTELDNQRKEKLVLEETIRKLRIKHNYVPIVLSCVALIGLLVMICKFIWYPSEAVNKYYPEFGYTYSGPLENGLPCGVGMAVYPNDDEDGRMYYVGGFEKGYRTDTARGNLIYNDGSLMTGNWDKGFFMGGLVYNRKEKFIYNGYYSKDIFDSYPSTGDYFKPEKYMSIKDGVQTDN